MGDGGTQDNNMNYSTTRTHCSCVGGCSTWHCAHSISQAGTQDDASVQQGLAHEGLGCFVQHYLHRSCRSNREVLLLVGVGVHYVASRSCQQ